MSARYRIEGEAPAGAEQLRLLAHDTLEDVPVELLGLKRHVWLRPGAREAFDVVTVRGPAALPVLGRTEHDGLPAVVRPRVEAPLGAMRLTPAEALATLQWLTPSLAGSPFRGRLTADDIWLDGDGHPRLMGVRRPENVGLYPPFTEPPEVAAGSVHDNSDLYALAAILYRSVSGVEPGRPPSDLAHRAAIPADVAAAIMAFLAEDAAARTAVGDRDAVANPEPPVIHAPPPVMHAPPTIASLPARRERWNAAVVVDTSTLDPAGRARLAVIAGVAPAAVERARKRELPFVVGAYADLEEAERVAGRFTRRNLPAQLANTKAPPIVQWVATAFLATVLGFASSGYVRYAFGAAAMLLLAGAFSRIRKAFQVARIGLAILDRVQSGHAEDAAGGAAAARTLLLRADLAPPVRAELLDTLDSAVDDLADLAAAGAIDPAGIDAAEHRAVEARVATAAAAARKRLAESERPGTGLVDDPARTGPPAQ